MVELLSPLQKGAKDKDRGTAFFMPSGASTKASLCSYRTRITLPSREVPGAKQPSRARSPSASSKPIAILLLGETGVEKATFVSGTISCLGLDRLPRPLRRSAG